MRALRSKWREATEARRALAGLTSPLRKAFSKASTLAGSNFFPARNLSRAIAA
jgi:hypothetical protein